MIIVKLMGGLGNQMFQYAAGRRLSQVGKVPLKLDTSWFSICSEGTTPRQYALHPLTIVEDFVSSAEAAEYSSRLKYLASLTSRFSPFRGSYLREKHYHFDPAILTPRKKAYLDGYWQSEKYFSDIRDIIVRELSVRNPAEGANRSLAEQIADHGSSSVALHVRRGDYVNDPVVTNMHGSCSLQYYAAAIGRMAAEVTNPHFFIFSDDPAWVSGNFAMDHPCTVVGHNGVEAAHEDLRLMSLCRHHIIANSSFSWWGAWLAGNPEKLVIAPKRWFANAKMDSRDVIPEQWLKL